MKKLYLSIIAVISIFSFSSFVGANPTYFPPTVQTNIATTTPAYLTAGSGNSIITYDSFVNGNPTKTDKATLFTQTAASSTSSVYGIAFEYSQDGIDWYADNLEQGATTTAIRDVSTANSYKWTATGTATSSKALTFPTPTRYTRVKYTVAGAAGAIWGQVVPTKEKNE